MAASRTSLRGTWIGHALHPLLTDVVVGSFTSATILDLVGGDDDSVQRLIAVGVAAYPPTALTGVSDWSDTAERDPGIRRAGLVHAVLNAGALSLYVASLAARRRAATPGGAACSAWREPVRWEPPGTSAATCRTCAARGSSALRPAPRPIRPDAALARCAR